MPNEDIQQEFFGNLISDFYTQTSVLYLAGGNDLESILAQDGRKVHRSIISQAVVTDYVKYNDISFDTLATGKQTLEVDTFPVAAEIIDVVDKNQTPYDLLSQASESIRRGLINRTEQIFLSKVVDAFHKINNGNIVDVSAINVGEIIKTADGLLGAYNVPISSSERVWVVDPFTLAMLREARSAKETPLGDNVDTTGIVGAWRGWTIVVSNNLGYSAALELAVNPTAGDTVTVGPATFTFVASIGTAAGEVLIGANVAATRTNLINAINGGAGDGTTYINIKKSGDAFAIMNHNILRAQRRVKAVQGASNDVNLTAFGAMIVKSSLTSASNFFKNQKQDSIFMIRGAIDLVMQFNEFDFGNKAENRFADKPKALIGLGAKMFIDGAISSVYLAVSAKNFGNLTTS
jgi:hypothetical protein